MYNYSNYPYQPNFQTPNYMQRAYNTQPQQVPQPQMQPPMSPQIPYEIPIQDVRFVTSEEAKAYIVMPNSKALLIDKNGTAYLKTADNMGQSQTQYFRFEPINPDGTPIKPQEDKPNFNPDDFVSVKQFKELVEQFEEFKQMMPLKAANKGATK